MLSRSADRGGEPGRFYTARAAVGGIAAARRPGMHSTPPALPDLTGTTILLVDDLVHDRGITASVLELAGAGIFEVGYGGEAKTTIAHLRPDVVITEMALPDATGVDLVRWIRAQARGREPATVVIALTRWAAEFPCRVARAAGFDGYFTKPPTTDDLVVAIAALWRRPRKAASG
jgi:CheY-like chemotaxis protein